MCMTALPASTWVPGAHAGQKAASDLLELWLEMVVKHHVGAGSKATGAFNHRTFSPALQFISKRLGVLSSNSTLTRVTTPYQCVYR